jgi:hypothetical protein
MLLMDAIYVAEKAFALLQHGPVPAHPQLSVSFRSKGPDGAIQVIAAPPSSIRTRLIKDVSVETSHSVQYDLLRSFGPIYYVGDSGVKFMREADACAAEAGLNDRPDTLTLYSACNFRVLRCSVSSTLCIEGGQITTYLTCAEFITKGYRRYTRGMFQEGQLVLQLSVSYELIYF